MIGNLYLPINPNQLRKNIQVHYLDTTKMASINLLITMQLKMEVLNVLLREIMVHIAPINL